MLKSGSHIRLVGDNINWHISISDERIGHSGYMRNGFAIIAVVQNCDFSNRDTTCPQRDYTTLAVDDFIPSNDDVSHVKREYCILMARAVTNLIPCFQSFRQISCRPIQVPLQFTSIANKVLPFSIVMKNEQKYSETVEILDAYEIKLKTCYTKTGLPFEIVKIQCGGDQMTCERFSGAKCLRPNHTDPEAAFVNLSLITYEFVHQHMNFVKIIFADLFDKNSACDVGTLKFMLERLYRQSLNGDTMHRYDAHKELL